MSFRGAWLQHAMREPDQAVLHTADPAHAGGETVPPAEFAYSAPPMQEAAPTGPLYIGREWVVTSGGTTIDHTNYDSHDATTADEGASRQRNYGVPAFQAAGEHYQADRFSGIGEYAPSDAALRRGMNALPENNPEGYPLGTVEQYWVDRKLYFGRRNHDTRVVTPNTAYEPKDVPPPAVGNQYTSPFSSLANGVPVVGSRPSLRRPPPPISDDLVNDSTEPLHPGGMVAGWVLR